MMSNTKISIQSVIPISSNEMLHVLCNNNLIGIFLEMCDLNTLLNLLSVNRRFMNLIRKNPIICDFIKERKISRRKKKIYRRIKIRKVLQNYFNYIYELRNRVINKYTPIRARDFCLEISKCHFNELTYLRWEGSDYHKYISYKYNRNNPINYEEEEDILKIVWEALKFNKTITELNLSATYFKEITWIYSIKNLFQAIRINKTITTLILSNFNSREHLRILTDELNNIKSITTLDFRNNSFGYYEEDLNILAELIKMNKTITTLNLSSNKVGYSKDLRNFFDAFKHNQSITTLDLSNNDIGENPVCVSNLAEAIKENKTITNLNLSYNHLGYLSGDLIDLSDAFKANQSITTLNLSFNWIGRDPKTLFNLSEAIKVNKKITTLNLSWNSLSLGSTIVTIDCLWQALSMNETISYLNLTGIESTGGELPQFRSNLEIVI